MKKIDQRLAHAIAGILAAGLLASASHAIATEPMGAATRPRIMPRMPIPPDPETLPRGELEICYGVVKAGKNDCTTMTTACGGTSTRDGQKDAWIFLPKGTCEKIVGSSLFPG